MGKPTKATKATQVTNNNNPVPAMPAMCAGLYTEQQWAALTNEQRGVYLNATPKKATVATKRTVTNALAGFCALNVVELFSVVGAWATNNPTATHAQVVNLAMATPAMQQLATLNPVLYAYNTASIVNAGINVKEAVACAAPTYTNRNGKHRATNSRAKFGRAHIVAWAKEQHAQKLVELKAQHAKATGSKKAKLTKQIKAMELNLPTKKSIMANTAHVHALVTLPSGLKARAHICGMAEHVNTLAWAVAPLAHVEWA